MNKKFTKLIAALALLVFMTPTMVGWGQTTWSHEFASGDSYSNNSFTVAEATWEVSTATPVGSPTISFGNMQKKYALKFGSSGSNYFPTITLATDYFTNYNVQSVTVNICNNGSKEGTLTVIQGNTTIGTTSQTFGQTWTDLTASTNIGSGGTLSVSYSVAQACGIHSISVTYTGGSTATPTTVTIDASGITNTDVYTSTTAGSLSATVKDNDNNVISGATVSWESSDENVATIDANGIVTLVAAGTTTITASYDGVANQYQASSDDYELVVTSSAPYVQPNPVEINMNYQWLGSGNGSNLNSNQLPVVKTDDNVTTTITDGTSTRPRGDADYIRIYMGSTLTFAAPTGYEITSIVFTTGGNNTWTAPTESTGTLSDKTWTGQAESVMFTLTGSCFISKVTITLAEPSTEPSVTVAETEVEVSAEGEEGTIEVTYQNFGTGMISDVVFYTKDGETYTAVATADLETVYPWITASINSNNNVEYLVEENTATTSRPAYLKVYAMDDDLNEAYSDFITITQAAAPQQFTLTVSNLSHVNLFIFGGDESESIINTEEGETTAQVTYGTNIEVSVDVETGYVLQSLVVDGDDVTDQITDSDVYLFTMPANDVTISATAEEAPAADNYELYTGALVEGDYVICYNNGTWTAAMKNVVNEGERLSYEEVTPNDGVISTNDASIVWHIAPSGDYWTIYNAAVNKYAASGNDKKAQLLADGGDDKSLWTVSGDNTYEFINKAKTNDYKYLRNNSTYGFACYKNTTGGALSLYKKVEPTPAGYTLTITAHTENGGWNLIASPVTVDPVAAGMITDNLTGDALTPETSTYELYAFDNNQVAEWRNYRSHAFNLEPGKGYLYASKVGGEFTLSGTPYSGDGEIELSGSTTNTGSLANWNLVGNPYPVEAEISSDYYAMKADGTDVEAKTADNNVDPMQGVFVVYDAEHNTSVIFEPVTETPTAPDGNDKFILNVSQNRGNVIDRAIVRMGEGRQLPKFQLFENSTKVYIPQNGKDYAIVSTEAQGELPVNFRASENGTYTLSIDTENVEMNYLHLIDNMTGMDIDLLQTPSYTFEANTRDYESRFRLVFAGTSTGSATDDNFAFFSNGNLIINNDGNATLQVIDLTGRILSSESVNGSVSTTLNATPGVYMLRLINGENVKVQKIVVR